MKNPRKVYKSFAIFICHNRDSQLLGRYPTLIGAYEALSKIKLTLGKPTYDLINYAEVKEQVWVGEWVDSETLGIYELSGTQKKIKEVQERITREYNELKKIEEAFNNNKIRKRI